MTFKEAYKFPLRSDPYGSYVWTADNELAFQFMNKVISDKPVTVPKHVQQQIVDQINGTEEYKLHDLGYNNKECMITHKGKDMILIRGWGHLTGSGCLRLSEDEACRIQDEFARFIIDQLK